MILNSEYYTFSSVLFYTNCSALLLNGRGDNLEYGSYAPGSADVFINDAQFVKLWSSDERFTSSPRRLLFHISQDWSIPANCFLWRKAMGKCC
ncbi:MAG: hypothetical protein NVS9B13_25720 [Candidatus Acidiferrum sp.]